MVYMLEHARLYELPDQSPTQKIDEKLAEKIGIDKTITFNKTITFEDVVKDSLLWLNSRKPTARE
jgi:hypothetical protein